MRIATSPVVAQLASSLSSDRPLCDARMLTAIKQRVAAADTYPRESLAQILDTYNHHIGNQDSQALENLKKLGNPDSCCVVTGQQLGMMGGPIYTILKGISCLLIARQMGAVPIFWLATEDHDTAEVDHVDVLDAVGNLKRFHLSLPKDGTSIETIRLTEQNVEELQAFFAFIGLDDFPLPRAGDLYAEVMARSLVRLFAGTGMLFLEPKLLRPLALPWIRRELLESEKIHSILKTTTEGLKSQGKSVAAVGEGTTLFLINSKGKRLKIQRSGPSSFTVGSKSYSEQELLAYLDKYPEAFSPNVFARPLVQNALLPIIAYVGGPAELAYHRQLTDYHAFHEVEMPCVIPRLSATLIPPEAAAILDACRLQPWEDLPLHWSETLPSLQKERSALSQAWLENARKIFGQELSERVLQRYVHLGEKKLFHRICRERLRRKKLPKGGLHLLENLIHPHKKPQERVLNWWAFQTKTSENLIDICLRELSWDATTPYYFYL